MVDPGHHADQEARDCGACHDPHGGDQRYFLRPPVDLPADEATPAAAPDPPPPQSADRSRPLDTGTQSGGPDTPR
jgi:predicted CXXCH cytochrome family protein